LALARAATIIIRMRARTFAIALLALTAPAVTAAPDTGNPPPAVELTGPKAANTSPAAPVVLPRGQMLYENHCQGCHESRLHVRENRRATSRAALRAWIAHWATQLKLDWGELEVDDVADYLNRRYYRLPLPGSK
jgi:cytochrome c5